MADLLQDAPITSYTVPQPQVKPATFRNNPHRNARNRPLAQVVAWQNILIELGQEWMAKPQIVASLANSWATLEDKRQVLIGYGKPKPVQARNEPGRRGQKRSKAGMIDPSTVPAHEVAQSVAQASTGTVPTQAGIDSTGPDAQDLQSHDGVWQG